MLIDSSLTLASGLIASIANKEHKSLAIVIFVSFAILQVFSDIFLGMFDLMFEPAVYIAYASIQITMLLAAKRLKLGKIMKILLSSTLIANALVVLHYIIVSNFGAMAVDVHAIYNPVVWSLMLGQLIYLLWIEKDVATFVRRQGYVLWANRPFSFLDRIMHSDRDTNRGSK